MSLTRKWIPFEIFPKYSEKKDTAENTMKKRLQLQSGQKEILFERGRWL